MTSQQENIGYAHDHLGAIEKGMPVVEGISVVGSLQRSFEIFKDTWGESLVGMSC